MSTIRDFKRGARVPTVNNLKAIRWALEQAGIEILDGDARALGAAPLPRPIPSRAVAGLWPIYKPMRGSG